MAEGCGRNGDAELARFLQIAMGSASELEYHFLLTRDLGYLSPSQSDNLASEVTQVKKCSLDSYQPCELIAES